MFEETKYENISSGTLKLLDILWKIEGNRECYIRTPYDYFGRVIPLNEGEYLLKISVKDEKGNTTSKAFRLVNKGDEFIINEIK